ncbi:hypothetical protein ACOMHN_014826 [Nucella lapillus]
MIDVHRFGQTLLVQKLVNRDPSLNTFDEHMMYYSKLMEEMKAMPATVDMQFVRINLTQLSSAIGQHAEQWLDLLGSSLRDRAKKDMDTVISTITVCQRVGDGGGLWWWGG